MTKTEWFNYAKKHELNLVNLIGNYHPVKLNRLVGMKITAPNAEVASETIRNLIKAEFQGNNPVVDFQSAIKNEDFNTAYELLNSAWFGVPESTECWNIDGFKEAVTLLEDPPEMEGE